MQQTQFTITQQQLLKITQLAGNIYKLTDGNLNNAITQQINIDARHIQLEVDKILRPEEWV